MGASAVKVEGAQFTSSVRHLDMMASSPGPVTCPHAMVELAFVGREIDDGEDAPPPSDGPTLQKRAVGDKLDATASAAFTAKGSYTAAATLKYVDIASPGDYLWPMSRRVSVLGDFYARYDPRAYERMISDGVAPCTIGSGDGYEFDPIDTHTYEPLKEAIQSRERRLAIKRFLERRAAMPSPPPGLVIVRALGAWHVVKSGAYWGIRVPTQTSQRRDSRMKRG